MLPRLPYLEIACLLAVKTAVRNRLELEKRRYCRSRVLLAGYNRKNIPVLFGRTS